MCTNPLSLIRTSQHSFYQSKRFTNLVASISTVAVLCYLIFVSPVHFFYNTVISNRREFFIISSGVVFPLSGSRVMFAYFWLFRTVLKFREIKLRILLFYLLCSIWHFCIDIYILHFLHLTCILHYTLNDVSGPYSEQGVGSGNIISVVWWQLMWKNLHVYSLQLL